MRDPAVISKLAAACSDVTEEFLQKHLRCLVAQAKRNKQQNFNVAKLDRVEFERTLMSFT